MGSYCFNMKSTWEMTNSRIRFLKKTATRFLRPVMRLSSGLMLINLEKRGSMNTNRRKLNKSVTPSLPRCTRLLAAHHQVVCPVVCQVASQVLMQEQQVLVELQVPVADPDQPLRKSINRFTYKSLTNKLQSFHSVPLLFSL